MVCIIYFYCKHNIFINKNIVYITIKFINIFKHMFNIIYEVDLMKETFKVKTYKLSNSIVVTIPSYLVKNKGVEEGKEYSLTISDEV